MKISSLIILLSISSLLCFGQGELKSSRDSTPHNCYGLGFLPSKANHIYGIAIGLIGSESFCDMPFTRFSHGVNLQIPGQGFLQTFVVFHPPFKIAFQNNDIGDQLHQSDTAFKRAVHNGILISLTGTFSDQINGLSVSGWMSMGRKVNGVSINPLWNLYTRINGISIGLFNSTLETKGIQIGLVNKSVKLKGIQLGLWNKNGKRSLPVINWNFND